MEIFICIYRFKCEISVKIYGCILTLSNIDNIMKVEIMIFDNNFIYTETGEKMPREKFVTLTEQMFYILLALTEECNGMEVMDRVKKITGGRVSIGPGTLYNLLEQFSDEGIIHLERVEGKKRSYIITGKGIALLEKEYARLQQQAADYRSFFGDNI